MVDEIVVPEEYSLDDLLADAPEVTVQIGNKEKKFWIRPPTSTERAMAQNAARVKSRQLRALLEDPETEEHQLLVDVEIENMSPDEMRLIWLASSLFQKTLELNRRSQDDRDDFFVPEPEGKEEGLIPPTNGELDAYEQEKIRQERLRLTSIADQQKAMFKSLQAKSLDLPASDLATIIKPLVIEQQASREWNAQYGLQVLIRCTFLDKELSQRAFSSPEEAMKLTHTKNGQKVLDELLNAHNGLMLDIDRLKN